MTRSFLPRQITAGELSLSESAWIVRHRGTAQGLTLKPSRGEASECRLEKEAVSPAR